MVSSGAYAFVTSDWQDKGYPLDLWLKHTTSIFDETSLVLYGPAPIPERPMNYPGLNLKQIVPPERRTYSFFTEGMQTAQEQLDTDWKVLLSIDEFLASKIRFEDLDESLVHTLVCRNLYGNFETEILVPYLSHRVARVHTGHRKIVNDGVVSGKRSLFKTAGQFWHTSFLRSPYSLAVQQRVRAPHEMAQGDSLKVNERLLAQSKAVFDYGAYRKVWPDAKLVPVDRDELPEVLLDSSRFVWEVFDDVGGRATRLAFELRWVLSYLASTQSRISKHNVSLLG